jgi:hypothetical protein
MIEDAHFLGHTRILRVRLDAGVVIEAMALSRGQFPLSAGSRVNAEIPEDAFHVLN